MIEMADKLKITSSKVYNRCRAEAYKELVEAIGLTKD